MRRTQTAEYWRNEFAVSDNDVEHVYELLVDQGVPLPLDTLAEALVIRRCQEEEAAVKKKAEEEGEIYRPQHSYQVGQRLAFPALGQVAGTVVGKRPGENPEYGSFEVLQVQFEGQEQIREFAASFRSRHRLGRDQGPALSPGDLYQRYGDRVRHALRQRLETNPDFVFFGSLWFLEDLLLEVHVGHLNIAEAMIVMAEKPLPTARLLEEIELSKDAPVVVREFSLNYALTRDPRFINVGVGRMSLWALAPAEEKQ